AWIVVSKDKKKAIFGLYCLRSNVNALPGFLKLAGLDPDMVYALGDAEYYGDELMNLGVTLTKLCQGGLTTGKDFVSYVEVLEAR
ncbi:MAG: GH36 C-terminal domain-containing protein, partial [Parasporobacterium sp.]|nr:GH36 C-terminal domain-containing protein [Parasporobacterium sp.]